MIQRVFWLLMTSFLLSSSLKGAEIIFRNQAKVPGDWIRLIDVAKVTGRSEAEEKHLQEILLGPTPKSHEQKILPINYLQRRLQQFGFDLSEHRIQFPEKGIRVLSSTTLNRLQDTEIEVSTLLEKFYPHFSRIEISLEDPDNLLDDLPLGLMSVEVLDKEFLPEFSDRISLMLEIQAGDQVIRGRFPADLHLYKQEVKTVRRLGMRLPVETHEVELAEWEVLAGRVPGYSHLDEVIGKKVKRIIPSGTRLLEGDVLPPILVEKGSLIQLVQEGRDIKIQLYGRALDDGRLGDEIKFEMPSGMHIKGKVIDQKKANVLGMENKKKSQTIIIGGES